MSPPFFISATIPMYGVAMAAAAAAAAVAAALLGGGGLAVAAPLLGLLGLLPVRFRLLLLCRPC